MNIRLPTMGESEFNNIVGGRFGRVSMYAIVDLDKDNVKVIPNTSHHMGGGNERTK